MDRRKVLVGVCVGAIAIALVIVILQPRATGLVIGLSLIFGAMIYPQYAITVAHANDYAAPGRVREDRRRPPAAAWRRHDDRADPRRPGDGALHAGGPLRLHRRLPSRPRPLHPLPHDAARRRTEGHRLPRPDARQGWGDAAERDARSARRRRAGRAADRHPAAAGCGRRRAGGAAPLHGAGCRAAGCGRDRGRRAGTGRRSAAPNSRR